jgi:hypothetical protein
MSKRFGYCNWFGESKYSFQFVLFLLYESLIELTNLQINYVELSSTPEVASCAGTLAPPSILQKLEAHRRFQKSPPLVAVLCQTNLDHTTPFCVANAHLNIIH